MADRALHDRRIVITGAGRGLGAAYAEMAAELGAAVVVNDVDPDLAEATAQRIRSTGGRALAHPADVSDWDDAGTIVAACVREYGGIDALVNNAGIVGLVRPIHEEREDARPTIDVNVLGVLYVGAHAARAMVDAGAGGVIVNATSGAQMGLQYQGTYSASKAAVATFTYSWARDLEEHGIRVNAIAPNTPTAQLESIIEQLGYNPEANHTEYPSKEDNAAVVMYLLSDASRQLNGQVVRVQHGHINVMSHPLIMEPLVAVEEFSLESVADAFEHELNGQLQPVGVATATVQAGSLLL